MAAEKSVLQPSLNLPISLSTIFHASIRRLAVGAAVIADASGGAVYLSPSVASSDRGGGQILLDSLRRRIGDPAASVPSRSAQESLLIGANSSNPLNVLVIGGGATGSGVALDAATRGLRLGLVEREDFSLGTSSRSTKLIHGEKAASKPTIVLEAVASQDLWIWYAFFGPPDTLNDINVLDRSPIFDDILEGRAPRVDYFVNGRQYNLAYYLTDGIYPKWAIFIQSILFPQGPKASLFAQCQEAARKDVERAFAVLQARFAIVKNPALSWNKIKIRKIMRACIILHNMIVEDERHGYSLYNVSEFYQGEGSGTSHVDLTYSTNMPTNLGNMMGVRNRLRDTTIHRQLKDDLVEHIWQKFGTTSD